MKNRQVAPDDLRPGMYVAVDEWCDEAVERPPVGYEYPPWLMPRTPPKPVGDPLRVLVVALPLVTVENLGQRARGVLDVRKVRLQQVGLNYVRSLLPRYGYKPRAAAAAPPPGPTKQRWEPKTGQWNTVRDEEER